MILWRDLSLSAKLPLKLCNNSLCSLTPLTKSTPPIPWLAILTRQLLLLPALSLSRNTPLTKSNPFPLQASLTKWTTQVQLFLNIRTSLTLLPQRPTTTTLCPSKPSSTHRHLTLLPPTLYHSNRFPSNKPLNTIINQLSTSRQTKNVKLTSLDSLQTEPLLQLMSPPRLPTLHSLMASQLRRSPPTPIISLISLHP